MNFDTVEVQGLPENVATSAAVNKAGWSLSGATWHSISTGVSSLTCQNKEAISIPPLGYGHLLLVKMPHRRNAIWPRAKP